jgi:polyisoprenoid-binding protein YceI
MYLKTLKLLKILIIAIPYALGTAGVQDTIWFTIEPESEVFYTADIRIAFVATTTIKGTNSNIDGGITWIDSGDRSIVQTHLTVQAQKFESGNNSRDRDVREILNVDKYPVITYELTAILGMGYTSPEDIEGEYLAVGNLTVRGVMKEVRVPVNIKYANDKLYIEGSTASAYTDFNIDPPRVAGFVGRAPDELRLHAYIVAKMENINKQ